MPFQSGRVPGTVFGRTIYDHSIFSTEASFLGSLAAFRPNGQLNCLLCYLIYSILTRGCFQGDRRAAQYRNRNQNFRTKKVGLPVHLVSVSDQNNLKASINFSTRCLNIGGCNIRVLFSPVGSFYI